MRLDRLLTTLGKGSRSQIQKMIRQGSVSVNGKKTTLPETDCKEQDEIMICGERIDSRLSRHVIMNKPAGVLTAARDPKQPTVMDFLPKEFCSIGCMPIGRLDKDVTGLLLFTTDGEMNHRLLSPARHVEKRYIANVDGRLTKHDVELFAAGIHFSDFDAAPAALEIIEAGDKSSVGALTIHEGKFHQVKRMFEASGHNVTSLRRVSFGSISLPDDLMEGSWRELTEEELEMLRSDCTMK